MLKILSKLVLYRRLKRYTGISNEEAWSNSFVGGLTTYKSQIREYLTPETGLYAKRVAGYLTEGGMIDTYIDIFDKMREDTRDNPLGESVTIIAPQTNGGDITVFSQAVLNYAHLNLAPGEKYKGITYNLFEDLYNRSVVKYTRSSIGNSILGSGTFDSGSDRRTHDFTYWDGSVNGIAINSLYTYLSDTEMFSLRSRPVDLFANNVLADKKYFGNKGYMVSMRPYTIRELDRQGNVVLNSLDIPAIREVTDIATITDIYGENYIWSPVLETQLSILPVDEEDSWIQKFFQFYREGMLKYNEGDIFSENNLARFNDINAVLESAGTLWQLGKDTDSYNELKDFIWNYREDGLSTSLETYFGLDNDPFRDIALLTKNAAERAFATNFMQINRVLDRDGNYTREVAGYNWDDQTDKMEKTEMLQMQHFDRKQARMYLKRNRYDSVQCFEYKGQKGNFTVNGSANASGGMKLTIMGYTGTGAIKQFLGGIYDTEGSTLELEGDSHGMKMYHNGKFVGNFSNDITDEFDNDYGTWKKFNGISKIKAELKKIQLEALSNSLEQLLNQAGWNDVEVWDANKLFTIGKNEGDLYTTYNQFTGGWDAYKDGKKYSIPQ